jgi:hypothetical protein
MAASVPTPRPALGMATQPAMAAMAMAATQPGLQPAVGSMTVPARPLMPMRRGYELYRKTTDNLPFADEIPLIMVVLRQDLFEATLWDCQ